jgi:16S rRNA C1402 (ribose-2'-O) methylase RsmI
MSQHKNEIFTYNETIRKPIIQTIIQPITNNLGVISKVVDIENYLKSSTNEQCCELELIKQNQKKFERQLVILLELCNRMDESITKINDKLSQYDIDVGDEVSHNGDIEDGSEHVEYNSDTEHQQPSNDIKEHVELVVDSNASNEVGVTYETSTCAENDTKEHVEVVPDVKPKRKYNRRKK